LKGRAEHPRRLIGESYDEEKMLPIYYQKNAIAAIVVVYIHKLILCYLFEAYGEAAENAEVAEKDLDNYFGILLFYLFHFYDSLTCLAMHSSVQKSEQKRLLRKVAKNQKKMKKWAYHAPMNYQHKYDLVEAERARVLNRDAEAMEYYDRAIAGARENEYLNEEALALELAAKFYLAKGKDRIAQVYMMDACHAYQRWGAMAKVKHLDEKYPQLLAKTSAGSLATSATDTISTTATTTTETTTEEGTSTLDLNTVMKASQTISGEIVLEKLLGQMMRIVIENAGAQTGCLILVKDGELMIEAEAAVGGADVRVLQSIPVKDNPRISEAIINYVARTKERVILNDAVHEGDFTDEPYIVENQPKSILCMPLIHQGKLTGILYLENNLTTGAFTEERLEVLNLLSAQAATSIENALLYENLEQLVDKRTQELSQALEAIEQAKEAAESELQDARQMQMALLPANPPQIEGFDIAGICEPATEVGGDYFNYFWLDEAQSKLGIVLMDVTGHGMKAAASTFLANGMLQSEIHSGTPPEQIMAKMNQSLCATLQKSTFVAMSLSVIDTEEKTLTHFNAGIPKPVIIRNAEPVELETPSAFPLGCWPGSEYTSAVIQLQAGDLLIYHSDGILEATNEAGEMYEDERFIDFLTQLDIQTKSAQDITDELLTDVCNFLSDEEESDDMTVVVVKLQ